MEPGRFGKNLAEMAREGGDFLPFPSAAAGILLPERLIPGGVAFGRDRKTRQ